MYKKFYPRIFMLVSIIFALIGVFNFIIDPYGLFRNFEKIGINQQKEGVRNKIRYVKSIEVLSRKPNTLIMGSSRVHDGINPESTSIPKVYGSVYNYGIPMIRIKELKFFLNHALKNQDVKNVVIGLDFFMFNSKEKLNREFDPEAFSDKSQLLNTYFKPYLSSSAFIDSINTVKASVQQKNRKEFIDNGYRPGSQVFYGLKSYEKLHTYTNWIFLSANEKDTLYYQNFSLDEEVFLDFKEILLICKNRHINLVLYISPAHATLDGEGIIISGKLAMFEEWKRKITNIAHGFSVPLWDFSGYNSITTEKVATPMNNYWDSSHFTERIGDLILAKILADKDLANLPDFGVKLLPNNIEAHLMKIRADREKYYRGNHDEVNRLHMMYRRALDGMKQNSLDLEGIF